MTCIVGLIDKKGTAHIASDSIGSNGHNKNVYKNKKIFKKGDMLIGYTSSYRMGQLLEHNLSLPDRKVNQTIENYMYVDFIAEVRKLLKEHGYLKIDSNKESIGEFLVLTEGRVFIMQGDLSLLESANNFDSCGSGEDYAEATIHTLLKHTNLSPEKIVKEAIETASTYIATVGGEVNYLSLEGVSNAKS